MDAANSGKAVVGRPFVKGQSGNPNGRPKMPAEMKTKLRKGADKGIAYWIELVNDAEAKPEYRIRAAENLVSYAYGKPTQAVDVTTDVVQLTETIDDRVGLLQRVAIGSIAQLQQLQAQRDCIYALPDEPDKALETVNDYANKGIKHAESE